MTQNNKLQSQIPTWCIIWLGTVLGLVALMMVVGAITRLTESGLSMVEWRPLIGSFPPMTAAEWARIFALYQETSQYQLMNKGMELEEFKEIFWWEYIHRVLGRVIGLAYGLPFLWGVLRGQLPQAHKKTLWLLLLLGATQGLIGWWMVKSGFVDRTEVSPVRLAVHLGMAFLISGLLLWVLMDWLVPIKQNKVNWRHISWLPLLLISITLLGGALTAGARAGYVFNDWPMMGGVWWPIDYWRGALGLANIYENPAHIQMNHRLLAYATLGFLAVYWWWQRAQSPLLPTLMLLAAMAQALLGITTLLFSVPIALGVAHQVGAIILFLLAVANIQQNARE